MSQGQLSDWCTSSLLSDNIQTLVSFSWSCKAQRQRQRLAMLYRIKSPAVIMEFFFPAIFRINQLPDTENWGMPHFLCALYSHVTPFFITAAPYAHNRCTGAAVGCGMILHRLLSGFIFRLRCVGLVPESHHLSITRETPLRRWLARRSQTWQLTHFLCLSPRRHQLPTASRSQSGGVWRQQWLQGTLREAFRLSARRSGSSEPLRWFSQWLVFLQKNKANLLNKTSSICDVFDALIWLMTLRYLLG